MHELSTAEETLLIALYQATDGHAEVYRAAAEADVPVLELLLHKGLILIEVADVNNQDQWYAALTEQGTEIASEITNRPQLLGVQIEFNLKNEEHTALVKQLADLANEDRADALAGLFGLHQSLTRGEIDALLAVYPDAVNTIRRMVQAGFEAELMTHEQQRIDKLLEEIGSLKAMVSQNGVRPLAAPLPDDDDESEPIAAPAPVSLKPVLPHIPEGQPKQLTVPQFDLPSEGDEESDDLFVVKKDEDAGRRASQNFIESLQKLQK